MKMNLIIMIAINLLLFYQINAAFPRDTVPSAYATALNNYNELHKKSNYQQTAGWLLFGGGAAMGAAGIIVVFRNTAYDIGNIVTQQPKDHGNTSKVLMYGGLGLALLSIPFIVSGTHNKRKARLFLKNESMGLNTGIKNNSVTSIGAKINF